MVHLKCNGQIQKNQKKTANDGDPKHAMFCELDHPLPIIQ